MFGREPTHLARSLARSLSLVVGVIGTFGLAACGRRGGDSGASARKASATARASASAPTTPLVVSPTARRRDPSEPIVLDESPADGGLPGITLRELSDVGPAGPATATEDGVLMLTKTGRLALARAAKSAVRKGKIGSVTEPATAFAVLGRAPAVAGGFAYWVTGGRLVRRRADGAGELETLADDARDGARVAAAAIESGVAVAYVGRPDGEGTSRVKLWLGPGRTITLTPEGAGASSVALASLGARIIAVSIDGRSAMTPVHARSISVGGAGPELGPDVVAWIAGPAHSFTEVSAGSDGTNAWALLPIERDATHFGLATVPLGSEPAMDAQVAFLDYENGIDLAPVATARLCGKPYVALARPTAAAPRSPQELVLLPIAGGQTALLANAAGFVAVSLAAVPEGGLVVYVADGRTWARGLECR